MILDLSGLEFFGTEGFSALVPGAAVSRLLRVCDPHGSLPRVHKVGAGLANIQDQRAGV